MRGVDLVIHGHYYQPPRENPWTEVVPVEPSAAPYHDWNARITDECYRPNGWARVVDEAGRVVDIVNCFELVSCNVGPTLLSWLEHHEPDVYARIIEADRRSGRAIAQGYGHAILPLCDEVDLRTQVRWGLADFAHRFGRPSAGMWLPETAVSDGVLGVLAEEGVGFTILAPGQIEAVRAPDGDWTEVDAGSLDPTRPLRWVHPDRPDLGVDLVVYDGALSHDLAFAGVSSEALVSRAAHGRAPGSLVAAATDGETFGHHHHFAERGLAYALAVLAPRRGIGVPRLADRLAEQPPEVEARVRTSAWSCVHGVGRWMQDCGCHTGGEPGWTQAWRAPLRQALDVLRGAVREVAARRGPGLLVEVDAARDAYIGVLLGACSVEDFAAEHVTGDLVDALTLLEAQRHALLMYTSCGWFFNDLAGLETVQILRYAARCCDLLAELGESPPIEGVLDVLAQARSNQVEEGDGRSIWARHVVPSRVDPERVVAHLALVELLGEPATPGNGDGNGTSGGNGGGGDAGDDDGSGSEHGQQGDAEEALVLAGHDVTRGQHLRRDRGGLTLVAGEVCLTHRRTRRRTDLVYAAVHLGGLEVVGAVRRSGSGGAAGAGEGRGGQDAVGTDLAVLADLVDGGAGVAAILREVAGRFGEREITLSSALPDAAEQIVDRAASALIDRFSGTVAGLHADHAATFTALARVGFPLPPELRAPVALALGRRFDDELSRAVAEGTPDAFTTVVALARAARADGVALGSARSGPLLSQAVERAVAAAVVAPEEPAALTTALELVRLARRLDLGVRLDRAQELVFATLVGEGDAALGHPLAGLGRALDLAVDRLGRPQ